MSEETRNALDKYASGFTVEESPVLQKIERETHLEVYQSFMLSGHLQGRFLSFISRMLCAEKIIEIGTFTGFSALCLAEGLTENGHLDTIDINDELEERCNNYFKEAGMAEKIQMHIGDARQLIPDISGPFDLAFIDADKPGYAQYFDLLIDKVRSGGIILADNVLYHEEVLLSEEKRSKNGRAIVAFNEKVKADKRVRPLLLPIRDGLFILEKQ